MQKQEQTLCRDVATTLVIVIEEGTEDTLSAKNAASMLLLVSLDAIENARKTTKASERLKTPPIAAQMHNYELKIAQPPE